MPSSTCAASITVAGTYTVTISGTGDAAASLTLGGTSGTQTLAIDATDNCSGASNAVLTLPGGGTIGASGKVELTQTTTSTCGQGTPELEVSGGTLTNSGLIQTDLGPHQTNGSFPAYLDGTIVNSGTITLNAITDLGNAMNNSSLDNKGAINLASNNLDTFNNASVTNDTGGSISNGTGTGAVTMTGGTYTQGAGTTSPASANPSHPAVLLNSSTLTYTGTGASSVVARGGTALSGSMASGQDLTIQATDFCSGAANAAASTAANFTNAGDIELTQTGNCGTGTPELEVTGGTFTNSGTIQTDLGPSQTLGSYPAYLDGTLVNTGTININASADLGNARNASSLDNQGTLTLSGTTNSTLSTFNGAIVTDDTGGSITNQGGTGGLVMNGGTYNQGNGTTNLADTLDATDPAVLLNNTALNYDGTGASSVVARGSTALSGNIGSVQNLTIQATDLCSGATNGVASTTAAWTNAGNIELTQAGGCVNGTPELEVGAGGLTNSGGIQTDLGPKQSNGALPAYLDGGITNTGTIAINEDSYLGNARNASSIDNQGTLSFTGANALTTENGATLTDDTGGSITNGTGTGQLVMNGGTYTQGAGTTSPATLDPSNPVVVLNNTALTYDGVGASSIIARGATALTGSLASGQVLTVQATDFCSGATNATATTQSTSTNAGIIQLTQTGGCTGGTPYLEVRGTLTNSGTIRTDKGTNQTTAGQLDGAFVNTGTIDVNTATAFSDNTNGSTLDNKGALDLATGATMNTYNGASVTDDTLGSISNGTGTGQLFMNGGTYTQGAGKISQTAPVPTNPAVILSGTTLKYTGKGKGTIVARSSFSETGSLVKGQDLAIEGTDFCSGAVNATMSPTKSFTNAGVITFTHAGGCSSDSDFITLGTAIKLTNSGTLSGATTRPEQISGGTVSNSGTVTVAAGDALELSSALTNVSTAGEITGGIYTLAGTFEYNNSGFATNGIVNNDSTITLTGSGAFIDGSSNNALRNLATNTKKLVLSGGKSLTTSGSLSDSGTISLGGGSTLTVSGGYTQTGTGVFAITLASATSYGKLTATGAGNIAGTFDINQTYKAAPGTSETVLGSSALTGTFTKVVVKNTGGKGSATPVASYTPTGVVVTG